MGIDTLVQRMRGTLDAMEATGDTRRFFLATYLRTTVAVRDELSAGGFGDAEWVERWDVVFADLYLDAVARAVRGEPVPLPWAVAFDAKLLPPLRHVLLGMNAHINFDLPQALVAVITSAEFDDPVRMAERKADHQRLDGVLAQRVPADGAATPEDRSRPGKKEFVPDRRDG